MRRPLVALVVLTGLMSVGVGQAVSAPGKLSVHIRPNGAICDEITGACVTGEDSRNIRLREA
jgi:hypothetical protein